MYPCPRVHRSGLPENVCLFVFRIRSEMRLCPWISFSPVAPKTYRRFGFSNCQTLSAGRGPWRITHSGPDLARVLSAPRPLEILFSVQDALVSMCVWKGSPVQVMFVSEQRNSSNFVATQDPTYDSGSDRCSGNTLRPQTLTQGLSKLTCQPTIRPSPFRSQSARLRVCLRSGRVSSALQLSSSVPISTPGP